LSGKSEAYDDWNACELALFFSEKFYLSKLPISAIQPLLRKKNEDIRDLAISRLETALRQKGAKLTRKEEKE
jgi:hypothetical protein